MTTVVNAGAWAGDRPLSNRYAGVSRTNAGEPNTSLTPAFSGEIVLDTTNNRLWQARGVTDTSWVATTAA